jgi:hypothetical protein
MIGLVVFAAQAVTALQPSGPWTLQTAQAGCRISRAYSGSPVVELGFETRVTGSGVSMMLTAPGKALPEGTGAIRVTIAPERAVELHYGAFQTGDPATRMIKLFPDKATIEAISGAESIEIGKQPIALSMRGVGAAIKALDDCTAQLLTSWGADPELYRQGKLAKPTGALGGWFTNEDYKRVVKSRRIDGQIVLLLKTAADGTPSGCKAVDSPDPEINEGTCAVALQRARFKPPLDADGKPMASYAVLPVSWIKP